ncbi:lipopolysaccharide core biosynthesis mannosyltransferase LpsB [Aureimonas endophytica]|uniref:Lipopolysaccharide core biosynthesis mannosyltransferase LpsB n=1 Tax=Aureimonas endophytica TaxID=2027858 RepID=A0A917E1P3_9HYPH|nr:lipopolysaccharide core biosynthesis mannosyltransferase LpsB [Aureimonas endophytica]
MKPSETEVVAPNFKRRLSGVTSTVVQLVPLQARALRIAALGPGLPDHLPKLRFADLRHFWRRPPGRPFRIWHARRNIEMLPGILLRDGLRMPLKLVFTSAAQRRHTGWTRFLIRRMDAVIATSGRSAAFLDRPATIILHGIDLDRFGPAGPIAEGFPGRLVVGCSGRIRPQKGTDLFVAAMIELLPDFPDWVAVATGRATPDHAGFLAELKAKVAAAGLSERILFPGEVADVVPWFRRFDLYVAPPRNEGFGLTPLEAMASGTPVVASDAGAFTELVRDGVTGRVVPAGDGEALTAAIRPFLADDALRARAGKAALADMQARFPLQREADEIRAVYERLWSNLPAKSASSISTTR